MCLSSSATTSRGVNSWELVSSCIRNIKTKTPARGRGSFAIRICDLSADYFIHFFTRRHGLLCANTSTGQCACCVREEHCLFEWLTFGEGTGQRADKGIARRRG